MTTDDTPQEAAEDTQAEDTTSADALAATIWPQVDRVLSGITAEAEMGVLDVIVRIPRDELVGGLRALKNEYDPTNFFRLNQLITSTAA